MKITEVECLVLLQNQFDKEACSSAQDNIIVKITTDTGIVGIGETDVNPWSAKAMIEAPGTNIMGLGLKEMLIGSDPLETTALWQKMYTFGAMNGGAESESTLLELLIWHFGIFAEKRLINRYGGCWADQQNAQ